MLDAIMPFARAFIVGGLICVVGEILLLETKLTSSRILVIFVIAGAILTAIGVYKPLVDFAGAGATVPLLGFGYSLATGAMSAVNKMGFVGAFTGGISNTAAGITAAILFGFINAILFKPKMKP